MCDGSPCPRQLACKDNDGHEWDTAAGLAANPDNPVDAECTNCGAISV